jgi:hypothetical protein
MGARRMSGSWGDGNGHGNTETGVGVGGGDRGVGGSGSGRTRVASPGSSTEYTPSSRTRRVMSCVYWLPLSRGLHSAHFTAQLEVLWEHIIHVRAQLEHVRYISTGYVGLYGVHLQLKLSGKGQGKPKLSGNGNECKPLP